ncbi:transposase [Roseivirga sp. BDSF3-8]|uniref:transposase n=1 Tax=Roseivirga sp. BDSF3-8 TaxID=3241598 RepID=UPI0035319473
MRTLCEYKEVKVEELNIQPDHRCLVCSLTLKVSISDFKGILKGKTAIMVCKN